jgi:hypothetical protein
MESSTNRVQMVVLNIEITLLMQIDKKKKQKKNKKIQKKNVTDDCGNAADQNSTHQSTIRHDQTDYYPSC